MPKELEFELKKSLSENIRTKITEHRHEYYEYIKNHYNEIILSLRKYENMPESVDVVTLEYLLRTGYTAIVGANRLGVVQLLGYQANSTQPLLPFSLNALSDNIPAGAINWLIDTELIPKNPKPLKHGDAGAVGDYIALTNKPFTFVNDFQTVEMYARRLCEIQSSRYSLIMQSKISTVLQFSNGDATADELIARLYDGAGYIKMSKLNPDRDILHVGGGDVISAIETLKNAYKEEIDELNNQLGINSVGERKESGISESEAESNNEYVKNATSIYTEHINKKLALLNKRFGLRVTCFMNQPEDTKTKEIKDVEENEEDK